MKDKIIVALDVSFSDAVKIIEDVGDKVGYFKVNSLFVENPGIVKVIKDNGGKVFLDLKFHDIPNTVANHCSVVKNVDMLTIHTSGGLEMMKKAVEAFDSERPLLLGVTVLTSIDQERLNNELKVNGLVENQVVHLAKLAKKAGLDGVIASAKETKLIKQVCGGDFLVVTPGIRPAWSVKDDQKRVLTPKEAIDNGSDYLVIGRAITGQSDRKEAVRRILDELKLS